MGGMMTAMGSWMLVWILLAVVLVVAGGVWVARTAGSRHGESSPEILAAKPAGVQEAQEALRLRYARGEISRYLQGKVELED